MISSPSERLFGGFFKNWLDERSSHPTENDYMTKSFEGIRELNAAELDDVAGGLSLGLGLNLDASQELAAVSGTIDQVGGLVGGLLGSVTGALPHVSGSVS